MTGEARNTQCHKKDCDRSERVSEPCPVARQCATSGIVAAGVVVGAIVETDCAKVSMGDRIPCRKPNSVLGEFSGVLAPSAAPLLRSLTPTAIGVGLYNTRRSGDHHGWWDEVVKFAVWMSPSARLANAGVNQPRLEENQFVTTEKKRVRR